MHLFELPRRVLLRTIILAIALWGGMCVKGKASVIMADSFGYGATLGSLHEPGLPRRGPPRTTGTTYTREGNESMLTGSQRDTE